MFNFCNGEDSIIYRKAYEFILNSSVIEDAFDMKAFGICISEEVLKPSTNDFSKQIIQYEYCGLDKEQKIVLNLLLFRNI